MPKGQLNRRSGGILSANPRGIGTARIVGSALKAFGLRTVFYGDGVNAEGSAPGTANWPTQFLRKMNGRVRGAVGWMQCKSGGEMQTTYARRQWTIVQQAPLVFIGSMGHNPEVEGTIFGLDPAVNPVLIDRWKRNVQAIFDGCPLSDIFVMLTCASSSAAEPYRTAVWDAQIAFIASLGGRVRLIDTRGFDPALHTFDGVHPSSLGGEYLSDLAFAVANPLIETRTRDQIMSDVTAAADYGANLAPDWAMAGTTGTRAGTPQPTGEYATGQRITNNLAGTSAIVVSKDASPGTYSRQIATLSGTPGAAGTLVQDDTGNITLTGSTPGTFHEILLDVLVDDGAGAAPVGLRGWLMSIGSLATLGNQSNVANQNADMTAPINNIIRVPPRSISGTSGPAVVNPTLSTRWSAVALTGRTVISRWIVRQVELVAYTVPALVGNDGIMGANYQLRITGTAGGTNILRGDPGAWSGGAISFDPKWYLNGVEVASGWTYTQATPASGTVITFRPRPTNTMGSDLITEVTVTVP